VIQSQQTSITAMCLHKASGTLLTGSSDGVVVVRSARALQADALRLQGPDPVRNSPCCGLHGGKVAAITLLQDGQLVVSAGWDDTLRFTAVSGEGGSESLPLKGQPVALSASGDLVLVITLDELTLFRGRNPVGSLAVSGMGYSPVCGVLLAERMELAIGGSDHKTHIYSISPGPGAGESFVIAQVHEIPTRSVVSALAYSPDGSLLAIGDVGRQVTFVTVLGLSFTFDVIRWRCTVESRKLLAAGQPR